MRSVSLNTHLAMENEQLINEETSNLRPKKGESLIAFPSDYVVIDIETTGLSPKNDSIIELAALQINDNQISDSFSVLVNPGFKIPTEITDLTGITNRMIKNEKKIEEVLPDFLRFVGDMHVVGYRVNFDINFIYDNSMALLKKPFCNVFTDVWRIARRILCELPHHTLSDVADYYKIDCTKHHRALDDCKITQSVFSKLKDSILNEYADIEDFIKNFHKRKTTQTIKKQQTKSVAGCSVTQRVKMIKQPVSGYLPINCFGIQVFDDGKKFYKKLNISPDLLGVIVDYLTRFVCGCDKEEAFRIALMGAKIASKFKGLPEIYVEAVANMVKIDKSLDDESIKAACMLASYDRWRRDEFRMYAKYIGKKIEKPKPDSYTIQFIKTMVERCADFFKKYGICISFGFDFSGGGYTETVNSGDGDLIVGDTLFDLKCIKQNPTKEHTLQLLMYWIMGQHSGQDIFKKVTKIGFFNPRQNTAYIKPIAEIPEKIIKEIEDNVICYKDYTAKIYNKTLEVSIEFLRKNPLVFFATICESKPKITVERIMEMDFPKIYFVTSSNKAMMGGLKKNPNVEMMSFSGKEAVRCGGIAHIEVELGVKNRILDNSSALSGKDMSGCFCVTLSYLDYYDFESTPPISKHINLTSDN